MTKNVDNDSNVEDEWPDYYADPVGHCVYALRHGNPMERCNAGDILRGLAWDAEPALPVIIEFMRNDPDEQVRAYCTHTVLT
jgi:hypothetical protein